MRWLRLDWHRGKWSRNCKCMSGGNTTPHRRQITFSAEFVSVPSNWSAEWTTDTGGENDDWKESTDLQDKLASLALPSGTEDDLVTGISTKDLTVSGASEEPEATLPRGWLTRGTVEQREYDVSSGGMFHILAPALSVRESVRLSSPLSNTRSSPVVEIDVLELWWLCNNGSGVI